MTEGNNCPFYGRHMAFMMHLPDLAMMLDPTTSEMVRPDIAPFNLINQEGNECALITDRFSPCAEEMAGRPVDWHTCELVQHRLCVG
jgi:hypothetical protein